MVFPPICMMTGIPLLWCKIIPSHGSGVGFATSSLPPSPCRKRQKQMLQTPSNMLEMPFSIFKFPHSINTGWFIGIPNINHPKFQVLAINLVVSTPTFGPDTAPRRQSTCKSRTRKEATFWRPRFDIQPVLRSSWDHARLMILTDIYTHMLRKLWKKYSSNEYRDIMMCYDMLKCETSMFIFLWNAKTWNLGVCYIDVSGLLSREPVHSTTRNGTPKSTRDKKIDLNWRNPNIYQWRFPKIGVPPVIIHFLWDFPYKPTITNHFEGYPHGYGNPRLAHVGIHQWIT